MTARGWLRVVLYRPVMQFGWLWLTAAAWFAVWGLPDGRWNRTFEAHAIATVTKIYVEQGAEDPDIRIEYVFRDPNGVDHTNYSIDDHASRDIAVGRELDVAYVANEPSYSELRAPGVRSRYMALSHELAILGLLALVGFVPILVDPFRAFRERGGDRGTNVIAERKRPEPIWLLFMLPFATLAGAATLLILYYG